MLLDRLKEIIESRYGFLPVKYCINVPDIDGRIVATLSDFDKVLGAYCHEHGVMVVKKGHRNK